MMQYQPGMSQIYPPPPTMARASSASSVTPTPEEGATYMTEQEMEQGLVGSLAIPDAEDEEEAGDALTGVSTVLRTVTLRWKIRTIRR
jgi:hypothetical protein